MSSFAKAQKAFRRSHKERAQPSGRARLGLLEKHKDYVLRARDYAGKERRLKQLKEKASFRNPDEFYHKMVSTRTKDGTHIAERNNNFTGDMWKLMATQDLTYANRRRMEEMKQVDKLQSSLHLLADRPVGVKPANKHTVFVESHEEVKHFNAPDFFDTDPALMRRPFNRLTKEQLATQRLDTGKKKASKALAEAYRELAGRRERLEKLTSATQEFELRKQLMTKGRRKIVGKDAHGNAMYKWKKERKR